MNNIRQDLRYGARMLLKQPGFTLIAVFTLAMGIGATTAIFSVVNAVLLRPLPYREPERLLTVWQRNLNQRGAQVAHIELTPGNFLDLQKQNQVFEEVAAFASHDFNLTGGGEPERVTGWQAAAALFPALGVTPQARRFFTADDDRAGAAPVVVISHGFWQRRFGGHANAVGQTLRLDERNVTVIGVLPSGFAFPNKGAELWTPLAFSAEDANARAAF
ncbi:MAG: ABC transporter permease [Blastocatellia bacterium]